ncbi:zinc finger BED domain-containing protein 1 [Nephila pilipes]|uniref:Zinc finger BED domain-containing protein 1 n=1 Tax=Nephila pilipes TaxID=299642 RepID=A0A8X6P6J2_NEPPI|nr:zinc finger BED domain-containing protein 1 [Nephila pilipes]
MGFGKITRKFEAIQKSGVLHFIENWILGFIILGVYELHENPTVQHLADDLTKTCLDLVLTAEKIAAVLTDGGENIVKAVDNAFGAGPHSYCFTHLLNLMAPKSYESLPKVTAVIEKVKNIVKWLKQSVVGSNEIMKKTEDKLIQSVITRRNSTF